MSGPSTYTPKPGFETWLDQRLPLPRLMHDTMQTFPTPRNLNIWYTFGGILTFCLGVQIVTGIVLAMHYVANAGLAFDSVERIMRDVNYGWLMRYVHANGASMFFLAVYIHMFRGLYYGSYKAPRELIWILGVLIYLLMMATAFFGYVLPWGQMSFWGATVITNLFSAIPVVGTHIATWLWAISRSATPPSTASSRCTTCCPLSSPRWWGCISGAACAGQQQPLGIDVKGPQDTVPFHPYYTVKDGFYLCLFVIIFAGFVFFAPNFFGNPDNYQPANPLVTPVDIVPEWYLLPFYAMLRSIPNKLIGVLVMGGALVSLVFIPWLDTSRVRSNRFRPLMKQFFWVFLLDCVLLGYCGSQGVDAVKFGVPLVLAARIATAYYFAYFWLLMPIIGLIETPKKLPASIAQSVLGDKAAAAASEKAHAQTSSLGAAFGLMTAAASAQAVDTKAEAPKDVSFSFEGPFGKFDQGALQRGFQVYKEVCSACHALNHVAFHNLDEEGGPGFTEPQAKAIAAGYKVPADPNDKGEIMDDKGNRLMRPAILADYFPAPFPNEEAARANNSGALPPDLSMVVKAREGGPQYVYSIITGDGVPVPHGFHVTANKYYDPYFEGRNISMPRR